MPAETTYSKRFGEDHYEVRRTVYATIGGRGFSRLQYRERFAYYINGVHTLKKVWFVLKQEARERAAP